jgi:hypothetical protein
MKDVNYDINVTCDSRAYSAIVSLYALQTPTPTNVPDTFGSLFL